MSDAPAFFEPGARVAVLTTQPLQPPRVHRALWAVILVSFVIIAVAAGAILGLY